MNFCEYLGKVGSNFYIFIVLKSTNTKLSNKRLLTVK